VKRLALALSIALLAYLASGLYFVQPDEQAVVQRFGAVHGLTREPGAHFGLPWGMDGVHRLKTREVKRVTIGPLNVGQTAVGAKPSQFLTGDRNLVNVRATVQFTISDPSRYLFHSVAADRLVSTAGESCLNQILAREPVDRALTKGKQDLGVRLVKQLQVQVEEYGLGITVQSVDFGGVEPPSEVADAFDKVTSAAREREQAVNQAQSFANRTIAQAQGDAEQLINQARAYRDSAVQKARGETQRFASLLAEYERAPALTSTRMYLETMAQILPRFRSKLILDTDSQVDLSIMGQDAAKEKKPAPK
jgi:membrane protease subunit HflK